MKGAFFVKTWYRVTKLYFLGESESVVRFSLVVQLEFTQGYRRSPRRGCNSPPILNFLVGKIEKPSDATLVKISATWVTESHPKSPFPRVLHVNLVDFLGAAKK
jgi:hypothetical protein